MPRQDDDPVGSARDEAERLIAAGLAAASYALRQSRRMRRDSEGGSLADDLAGLAGLASRFLGDSGRREEPAREREQDGRHQHHRGGWNIATGSAACCVCPICRAIDLLRDPPPEFVERLATGASDLAAGVTSVLRAFGERAGRGGPRPDEEEVVTEVILVEEVEVPAAEAAPGAESDVGPWTAPDAAGEPGPADAGWAAGGDFGSVWQAATRAADEGPQHRAAPPPAPKPMAKKAVKRVAPAASGPAEAAEHPPPGRAAMATPAEAPPTGSAPDRPAKAAPAQATAAEAAPGKAAPGRAAKAAPGKAAPGKAAKAAPGKAAKAAPGRAAKSAGADTTGSAPAKAAEAPPAPEAAAPADAPGGRPGRAAKKTVAKKAGKKAAPRKTAQ